MALLISVFLGAGLITLGTLIGLIFGVIPQCRPYALKWFVVVAGTGFFGTASTFGLVYFWEKFLGLSTSEQIFLSFLFIPLTIIFPLLAYIAFVKNGMERKEDDNVS